MLLHPLALGQHSVRAKQVINSIATPSSLVRMIAYNKLNEFLIIYNNSKYYISQIIILKTMIPLRSGGASTALQGLASSGNNGLIGGGQYDPSSQAHQLLAMTQGGGGSSSSQQKKSVSKQRTGGAATSQGMATQGLSFVGNNTTSGSTAGFGSNSAHRGSEGVPNMQILMHPHNQTVKIPQQFLSNNIHKVSGIPNMTAALSAAGVQAPSSLSMNSGVLTINGSQVSGPNGEKNLSASQKKRISLKKLEEEYCKTIEQIGSPNSSTLNLENMKKTHSLHYMRAGSGASSPQQIKSRSSIGKYGQNAPPGIGGPNAMAVYNNYNNNHVISSSNNSSGVGQIQQRNSFVSKSQIGQVIGMSGGAGIHQQQMIGVPGGGVMPPGSALGAGNRSRSKTTTRKKRNLYTSMGNYYQSQQAQGNQNAPQTNNSASRVTKRVHQQNFLDNLEQTNILNGGNLAAAHQMLVQEEILNKKRNKSSTKSYNNKELLDHNASSEQAYNSNQVKKNPLTNNFFDVSQLSSNHTSVVKNFENSFQFTAGGFLQPTGKTQGTAVVSLNVVGGGNKQRPTSSHKSALMQAAQAINGGVLGGGSSSAKPSKKKSTAASSGIRKSLNNFPTSYNSSNLMNSSANYGHLQQNAYDFLSNASLFLNSNKAARRPKGGNSAIDSRCSQNKDHIGGLGLVKSQVASNTAFGHQQLNNTSHTTICSNRKGQVQGEIVSGKKNSLQQQMIQQNYLSMAGNGGTHNGQASELLTAGEISSDRQTLKMNDFLKQIEAYSNDKLDKFMPQMMGSGGQSSNAANAQAMILLSMQQQAKVAEQVKALIEREMNSTMAVMRTNSSKQRYPIDESRGGESNQEGDEDDGQPQLDYEHLLNVISESFNSLISTFYQSPQTSIVGASLAKVKESYEDIINSIVENLSQQIETLQGDCDQLSEENSQIKERNSALEQFMHSQEQNSKQVAQFVRQNEALNEEVLRLKEENKALKKDQRDKDTQLVESIKIIEKLSASQKQLITQPNHNHSSGSSKIGGMGAGHGRYHNDNSQFMQQSSKNNSKLSAASVPPLDLGKVKMVQQQQANQHLQPMLSNDSVQTLDKALLNANLQDPSQSSVMNTVAHHDGSRMLEELYSNHNNVAGAPFDVNQSDISYVNSDENYGQGEDGPSSYLNSGGNNHPGVGLTQSGRQSSIAQDKSPIMKPFIPPLNLNGLNNRQQAALQGKQQAQSNQVQHNPPQAQQHPIQAPQPKQLLGGRPSFKLDLSGMPPPGVIQPEPQFPSLNIVNKGASILDQDNFSAEPLQIQAPKVPAPKIGGLGLNFVNLKQQKGIVDFQDEFNAKYDEFSESWRNAMNREKRF